MFKDYVIFREDSADHKELYIHHNTDEDGGKYAVIVADNVDEALTFGTAREAYDWAGARKLDWWKVGLR